MKLRVSTVQYHLHSIARVDEFRAQATHYVKTAAESGAEFLLFPEFMTTQLLSIPGPGGTAAPIGKLPEYTSFYESLFRELAVDSRMHIIAGTHLVEREGKRYNTAYLFYPDGSFVTQPKLHVTPTEAKEWNVAGGDELRVFATEKGKVAVLVCYDIEFPELARLARARGADVIFCPSCTDDKHGFHRVRYTAHARAIENEVYVVTSVTVGSLPTVDFMRSNYGSSAVISPNDIPFPPAGVVAEGELNHDMVVTADLDLSLLREVRERGSVTTWRDRRTDLYPDWT